MYKCEFREKCINSFSSECDMCHFNPEACTINAFEWNGEGIEPEEGLLNNSIVS